MDDVSGLSRRQAEILRRLSEHGFVSTTELAGSLGVSDMTIRRDTRELARQGALRLVHGGAALPHGRLHTAGFAQRAQEESEAKGRIARACQSLIPPGATIVVDAGTTAYEVAHLLPPGFAGTIITHSAPVIQHALQLTSARTVCLGGELLLDSQAFIGALTVSALHGLRAQTAFIGVAAVRPDGLYIDRSLELPTKMALVDSAERIVVTATGGKMNASATVRLMALDRVDALVTDAPVPADIAASLSASGVELVVADASSDRPLEA
jgi:DeoR/GlpR family transcriptional regulator of sugar metabolism